MALLLRHRFGVFAAALASTLALATEDSRPVMEFDFYRAMQGSAVGAYALQNFNLASIAGVSKYIHTEVIAEHVIGDVERTERKNGIDTIARLRFKVRNPTSVLTPSGQLVTQVDFGPFVTFDSGVATNPQTQFDIQQYGGYVGVQQQTDVRWPYTDPYFWFSVTGWCPNVRYDEIPRTRPQALAELGERSRGCEGLSDRAACRARPSECTFEEGACVARDPAPGCLNSTAAPGHVLGGLCPSGADNLTVEPTGKSGCTYSYGHASQLSLDRVVGILGEDCGSRLCTDWLDFRRHCSNSDYRRKFDAVSGKVLPFKYCVEYDVHPDCESDCRSDKCLLLPEAERELGLPFWRGKCNARANEARTESFGRPLGSESATTSHNLAGGTMDVQKTCIHDSPGICTPLPGQGGNYCTRQWAGVCFNCFIPGTLAKWPARHMPYCPYNILHSMDYKDSFPAPKCNSSLPRDLCCLYTGSCSLSADDFAGASLDDDGFALVASWQNTTAMTSFLKQVAISRSMDVDLSALHKFAYSCWALNPRKGASLKGALQEMLANGVSTIVTTSTATATSTTPTSTSATMTTTESSGAIPPIGASSSKKSWVTRGSLAGLGLTAIMIYALHRKRSLCLRPDLEEGRMLPSAEAQAVDLEAQQRLPAKRVGLHDFFDVRIEQQAQISVQSVTERFTVHSVVLNDSVADANRITVERKAEAQDAKLPVLLGRSTHGAVIGNRVRNDFDIKKGPLRAEEDVKGVPPSIPGSDQPTGAGSSGSATPQQEDGGMDEALRVSPGSVLPDSDDESEALSRKGIGVRGGSLALQAHQCAPAQIGMQVPSDTSSASSSGAACSSTTLIPRRSGKDDAASSSSDHVQMAQQLGADEASIHQKSGGKRGARKLASQPAAKTAPATSGPARHSVTHRSNTSSDDTASREAEEASESASTNSGPAGSLPHDGLSDTDSSMGYVEI